jgi:hypothetical protein
MFGSSPQIAEPTARARAEPPVPAAAARDPLLVAECVERYTSRSPAKREEVRASSDLPMSIDSDLTCQSAGRLYVNRHQPQPVLLPQLEHV